MNRFIVHRVAHRVLVSVVCLSGAAVWWSSALRDAASPSQALAHEPLPAPPVTNSADSASGTLRRPVALVLCEAEQLLLTANRCSGTISIVDLKQERVARDVAVGKTLADLQATPDGRFFLAVDEAAHELIALRRQGANLKVAARISVSPYPVTVRVSPDARRCYVASLWSRRLTAIDLSLPADGDATLTIAKTLELPFAPRLQVLLPEQVKSGRKLVVADSFAGQLGIVDAERLVWEGARQIPAHNIRGLAVAPDGKRLLIAHQILNDLAETSHNDVHWGVLLSNVVRWVMLDRFLAGQDNLLKDSQVQVTGDFQTAGADPSGLAVAADGQIVVASAGVDQVAFGREGDYNLARVGVGQRPVAVVAGRDPRWVYVAHMYGDSVGVVDLQRLDLRREISLGQRRPLTLAEQGETLFHNGKLALNGWMSCHSCHTDGHSNGLLNDNMSDGSFGSAKRVLSLLGVADTAPFAWNGKVTSLEEQARRSVRSTMQGLELRDPDARALAAYLKTLPPPPPLGQFRDLDKAAVARGRELFKQRSCATCHQPPTYAGREAYDVGLTDKQGQRLFNPPSLRGVSQRGPYFHDNRAASLEEVLGKFRHPGGKDISQEDVRDLVTFLQTL